MKWMRRQEPKRKWARDFADWPGINAAMTGVLCLGLAWILTVIITGRTPSEFGQGGSGSEWADLTALILAGPLWLVGTISGAIGAVSLTIYFTFWLSKRLLRRRAQRKKEDT